MLPTPRGASASPPYLAVVALRRDADQFVSGAAEIVPGAPAHPVGRQRSAQPAGEISELRDGGAGDTLEVVLERSDAFGA